MNYILRAFMLMLTTFSIFNYFFKWLSRTPFFDYSDEVLLGFCFIILGIASFQKKKIPLLYFAILLFLTYSILISYFFGLNVYTLEIIVQSIINIKFFIILAAFVALFKNHTKQLEKYFSGIIVFVSITLVVHLFLGEAFNNIYGVSTYMRPNIRYVGVFRHPNHLAYLAVLYIALLLNTFKKQKINIDRRGWIKIFIAVFVIVLADTRTAMLAIAFLLATFYWDYIYKDFLVFFSFIFIGFVALFFVLVFTDLPDTIMANIAMSYSLESNYIRGLMFYMSLLIIYLYFPIGAGAGTFGSIFAKDSQVYKDFGVSERYYFVNEWGIYDSNIASILGEYGLIGILLYFFLFKATFLHLNYNLGGKETPRMLKAFIWVFVFFCISNPMITNSVYILLSVPVFLLISKTEE